MEDTFINKVSDDEAAFVVKCYKYLLVLGVIRTKAEFSVNYLGKSKDYMAVMQTKNRKPSINCLHNLIKTMEDTAATQEDKQPTSATRLNRLITEGRDFITKRILKYL